MRYVQLIILYQEYRSLKLVWQSPSGKNRAYSCRDDFAPRFDFTRKLFIMAGKGQNHALISCFPVCHLTHPDGHGGK